MTARAASGVAVDWQVEAQPGADPATVLALTGKARGVSDILPVAFGQTSGFEAVSGGTTQTTGPGFVLGLPPGYRSAFPGEIRDLSTASGGSVLLAQQTAANLHAAPGDLISVGRASLPPASLRIDGVVELPNADSLFQKVGAPLGAQPQAPPDNVLIVSDDVWHQMFDPLAVTRPDLVHFQVHAHLSHDLPPDPAAAYQDVSQRARNLEVGLAGSGLVGDNLGATLGAARSDALYAQVLFLFLGMPGAVLAGLLTAAVAGSGAQRRRREQALLRARGATVGHLVRFGVVEAMAVGVTGAAAGLVVALLVGRLAFGTLGFGATTSSAILWAAASVLVGLTIAALTIAVPAWKDARRITVVVGRTTVGRASGTRWARYGLDLILLAAAGIVFWLTGRNGYKLVLAPEGVPQISVSYWAFAGPALLWSGAGLFSWRIANLTLQSGRSLMARLLRPVSGNLSGTVAASMSRQRRLLARSLALVALTVSFAASTAVFNDTYRQQAEVDARLSNGADVTVNESPGSSVGPAAAAQFEKVDGVSSVEPIQHRFAYVGADLQDLYGVRPETIVDATRLQDAYFEGGTAREVIGRLKSSPDSVLVSAETVRDFQLHLGDRIVLRLQDARTKQLTDVPFHYAGVAVEFPTAPNDSFLIANAGYVAQTTGSEAVGSFLIGTGGKSPAAVAHRIRALVGSQAQITDIATSRRVVGSSLTAVDLSGLTRVELGFALVLAAAATGLILTLGMAERRRTYAIANALGARPRQIAGFVWSEALFVTAGGLTAGALGGWALSHVLVKVLTGVFDPYPAALAVPWTYLGGVAAAAILAVGIASMGAVRATRRAGVEMLREL